MPQKIGRPCKDNPKDTRIQVRLDKETLKKLDECAKEKNTTRSEVIREGIVLVNGKLKKATPLTAPLPKSWLKKK